MNGVYALLHANSGWKSGSSSFSSSFWYNIWDAAFVRTVQAKVKAVKLCRSTLASVGSAGGRFDHHSATAVIRLPGLASRRG